MPYRTNPHYGDVAKWETDLGGEIIGLLGWNGTPRPVNAAAVPIFVGAEALATIHGTRTIAAVSDFSHLVLDAAVARTSAYCCPSLVPGVGYEVFVWISGSTLNVNTPIYSSFDATIASDNVAFPAGVTKYALSHPSIVAANTPVRQQLPISVLKSVDTKVVQVRYDRRGGDALDTYVGQIQLHGMEFVPINAIVNATVVDNGIITPQVIKTPFDGQAVKHDFSQYTPVWTATDGLWVTAPVTITATEQSRAAKLNKTTFAVIENTQLLTGTHDTITGHRDSSICVDASNKVIVHGELHHSTWSGKVGTAGTLVGASAISAPTGAGTNCSYRRFFRNPYNGEIWLGMRGDTYYSGIYKWNGTGFDRKPAGSMIGGEGTTVGYYGMELAFASANTIYATLEPIRVTAGAPSGSPRQNIGCIKSVDGGATWTTLRGNLLALPLQPGGDNDIAFPTFNNLHTATIGRIAVASDGNPVIVASWRHPDETLQGTWAAKWDGNKWVRRRLLESNGRWFAGTPHLAYTQAGEIYVTASTEDDHTTGSSADGGSSASRIPDNNVVYLFKSTDGLNWQRWTINNVPVGGYGGVYIDSEAIRLDNRLVLAPRRASEATSSEIWVAPLV
jgi:hypothetical protein